MGNALTSILSGLAKPSDKPTNKATGAKPNALQSILESPVKATKAADVKPKPNALQSILLGSPVVKVTKAIDAAPYVLNLDDFTIGKEVRHRDGLPLFIVDKRTRDRDGQVWIYRPSGDRHPVEDLLPVKEGSIRQIQDLALSEWGDIDFDVATQILSNILKIQCPHISKDDFGNEWVLDEPEKEKAIVSILNGWNDYKDQVIGQLPTDLYGLLPAIVFGSTDTEAPAGDIYLSPKVLMEWVKKQMGAKMPEFYGGGFITHQPIRILLRHGDTAEVADCNGVKRTVPCSAFTDRYIAVWNDN